jgi:hypothetical protein
MTSQVALMNLYGVALASDTLASRKADDGYITSEGNNKIWTITGHQVQALHYGNTLLGGIPHKIHFEAWVRTLTKPLPNIQAYVTSYKKYCESPKSIHSTKSEGENLKWVFKDALNRLSNKVGPQIANLDSTQDELENQNNIHKLLESEAKSFDAFYKNSHKFEGATKEWLEQSITKFKIDLNELILEVFDYPVTPRIKTVLKRAMKNFALAAWDIRSDTNLVFVGFGSKDEFAGSQRLRIRGVYNQKLLAITEGALYVSPDDIDSRIIYAAQADAMKALLQGYHPRFGDRLEKVLARHIQDFLDGKKMERHYGTDLTDKITEELADFSSNSFINPAFNAIMNMSPEQLAASAKGLVVMQAAAAAIGTQTPTVGGPVEVSTITKQGGVRIAD